MILTHFVYSNIALKIACVDVGDCDYNCLWCGAYFWYMKRVGKNYNPTQLTFSMCCSKGKIQLPLLNTPPDSLVSLINGVDQRSFHFLHNIRSYNSMFAFTSIGRRIVRSVNDGSGPSQFI